MKHSPDEIITAIHVLKEVCLENGFGCSVCPLFSEEKEICGVQTIPCNWEKPIEQVIWRAFK